MEPGKGSGSTGLSFEPRAHTDGKRLRQVSGLLVLAGIAMFGWAIGATQDANPVRLDGTSAVGQLIGFDTSAGGQEFALVQFTTPGGTFTARSDQPAEHARPDQVGLNYEVFYLEADPHKTFIDGIDQPVIPWPIYGGAGAALLLGVAVSTQTARRRAGR